MKEQEDKLWLAFKTI